MLQCLGPPPSDIGGGTNGINNTEKQGGVEVKRVPGTA